MTQASETSQDLIKVPFNGDTIFAVERDDGVFVAIKPICEAIGLAWQGQLERIKRDTILAEGISVTLIPSAGGGQRAICLRLDLLNGWLFTIDDSRVKDEAVREKVLTYKRECYRTLFLRFFPVAQEAVAPDQVGAWEESGASLDALRTKVALVDCHRKLFAPVHTRRLWAEMGLPGSYHSPRELPAADRPDSEAAETGADCLSVLLAHELSQGATVEDAIAAAGAGEEASRSALSRSGVIILEDGIAVANAHPSLAKIYKGSEWAGGWRSALRGLPGAEATKIFSFGGVKSRATLVPGNFVRQHG